MIDWYIEARSFGNCNCDYGCPCQFEEDPTHGNCRGFEVFEITKGHFGETKLDGLRAAIFYCWPGPIYKGAGEIQVVIDHRASTAQREALVKVLHGEETEPGATHWWVFRSMSETLHPTLFEPIELEIDIDGRRARAQVGSFLKSTGRPIRSPATGDEHRVRIDIPNGIEFELAEIGSATTTSTGPIKLDLQDSFGQFNMIRHSGSGVVHTR